MWKKSLILVMISVMLISCAACKKTNVSVKNSDDDNTLAELSVFSYKPDTLFPIASDNNANIQMLGIIYEGLVELSDALLPIPMLADSWSVSQNGLEWVVNLKKNVLWHDNSGKLSPEDVVYTVNKIKSLEKSPFKYNVSNIAEVSANGKNQVKFVLEKPNANFVNLLYFPIVKKEDNEIDLANFKPNGTGPYKFEDRSEGNVYYLVQNPDWWGGKVNAETIKVKIMPSNETALYAFGSGSIDLVMAENMDWGKFIDPSSSAYATVKTPIYNFLGINHANKVLANAELRRAISLALDRKEICEEARMGYAESANSPVRSEWSICENQEFDHKQDTTLAKKILEESGWTFKNNTFQKNIDGVVHPARFSILINEENTTRENIARIIVKNLEEFGVRADVVRVTFEEYQKRIAEGRYDTFIGSMALSPNLDFSEIFGDGNMFAFEDEELSFVMNAMQAKTDFAEVKSGYAEFINLFEQLNPVLGLFFENSVMVYTKEIKSDIKPSYFDIYNGIETLQKGEAK